MVAVPAAGAAEPQFEAGWTVPGVPAWPTGLATGADGSVFMVDAWNDVIRRFDAGGTQLASWGQNGTGDGDLNGAQGIDVHGTSVYVADSGNNRIQRFSISGSFQGSWGSGGAEDGQFQNPVDVAVGPDGSVYVADTDNHRVQKFSATGSHLATWGGPGTGNGRFNKPAGIAVDGAGHVYVSDTINRRVQKFTSTGAYVTQWSLGANGPSGIDVDAAGNVFVVDRAASRVGRYTADGGFVGFWGSQGPEDGQFETVLDVAASSSGSVFVSDMSPRIQRFSYSIPVRSATWGELKSLYDK
jgi:DNA-binding beta-propeller fold protein YncE